MRISIREDETLHWNSLRVQMKVDCYDKAIWRECLSEAFNAYFLVKAFNWAAQGVILMDFKVNNVVANAVYNPGCAGIEVSKYLESKANMKPFQVMP